MSLNIVVTGANRGIGLSFVSTITTKILMFLESVDSHRVT